MPDGFLTTEDELLASLTDEEQLSRLQATDNGPKSDEDAAATALLPQDPGSRVRVDPEDEVGTYREDYRS